MVNIVSGVPASSTADLSGLADGPITATLHLNPDPAGNSFTDVVVRPALDQDTGEQAALHVGLLGDVIAGSYAFPTSSNVYGHFNYSVNPFVVDGTVETILTVDNSITTAVNFNANSLVLTLKASRSETVDPFNGPDFTVLSGAPFTSVIGVQSSNPIVGAPVIAYVSNGALYVNWSGGGGNVGDTITIDFAPTPPALTVNGDRPIGAAIAGAVPFTVAGLEPDDSGTVAFSDGVNTPVVINIVNGAAVSTTANLSGLTDGTITATLHLNADAAGNTFTDVVVHPTLDQDTGEQAALSLAVNGGKPIGAAIAGAVPFAVGGLETDDSGTVTFSDGTPTHNVVVNIAAGVAVSPTANLSGLTDGTITATLQLNDDAGGNSFTDVVATATLDQDTNDYPAVTLTGLTGGKAIEDTAVTATVTADDLPSSGITYAWQVSHDGGATWTPIPGATSNSYTPIEPDEGGQLQAQVSFTDSADNNETGTATVLNVVDVPPALSVALTGTAQEGQALTATASANSDEALTVTYQWQSSSNGGTTWTNITGATNSTYTLQENDESNLVRVQASVTDDTGQTVEAISNVTTAVKDVTPTLSVSISTGATYTLTGLAPLGGSPASYYSFAYGINDAGQVVGYGTTDTGFVHAPALPFSVRRRA